MPLLLRNIPLALDEPEDALVERAAQRLGVPPAVIRHYAIVRRSLDARRKDLRFSYHVEVALDERPDVERGRLRRLRKDQAVWIEASTAGLTGGVKRRAYSRGCLFTCCVSRPGPLIEHADRLLMIQDVHRSR